MKFSKKEVETILKRVIHQDSLEDVHYEAKIVAEEFNINIELEDDFEDVWDESSNSIIIDEDFMQESDDFDENY